MHLNLSTLALGLVAALPVVLADPTSNTCNHATVKSPKPQGFRCGAQVVPTGKYATRAKLATTEDITEQACHDQCFNVSQDFFWVLWFQYDIC